MVYLRFVNDQNEAADQQD